MRTFQHSHRDSHLVLTAITLLLVAFGLPTIVLAGTPISGSSPYPDGGDPSDPVAVTACNARPQIGRVFRNSETEPYLAVNPTNVQNMIAGWHQDRWSNGGAQGNRTVYTTDGGTTWTPVNIPFTRCAGAAAGSTGDFERASDPWISFGGDGVAYYMSLVFNSSNSTNGMAVSRSADGGVTWSQPVFIKETPANGGNSNSLVQLHDKNSMTADPNVPGLVYATWTLFRSGNTALVFTRSTDAGETWEPARPVNNVDMVNPPARVTFRQGVQIVVLPDGTLVNAFFRVITNPQGGGSLEQAIFRSSDQGRHWERLDTTVAPFFPTGGFDLELGIGVRDGGVIPDIAVDRNNGNLYIVWQDGRLSPFGFSNVLIARSTDGGETWSSPAPVTNHPTAQAFLPEVAVADDGTVGVMFYDFRNDVLGDAELTTDVHLRTLDANLNVLSEQTLTATSFDMRQMVIAGGYFPGDYVGFANAGNDFVGAFTVANNLGLPVQFPDNTILTVDDNDRQDIVFERVTP